MISLRTYLIISIAFTVAAAIQFFKPQQPIKIKDYEIKCDIDFGLIAAVLWLIYTIEMESFEKQIGFLVPGFIVLYAYGVLRQGKLLSKTQLK